MSNHPNRSKYIGGFDAEERPVAHVELNRMINEHRHLGATRAQARAACMRILRRGDWLRDQYGFGVRLRRLP